MNNSAYRYSSQCKKNELPSVKVQMKDFIFQVGKNEVLVIEEKLLFYSRCDLPTQCRYYQSKKR